MREIRSTFQCRGQGGRVVTVLERQEMTMFQPLTGPARKVAGPIGYVLAPQDGGGHVSWIDDTKFRIVTTGEILTRI